MQAPARVPVGLDGLRAVPVGLLGFSAMGFSVVDQIWGTKIQQKGEIEANSVRRELGRGLKRMLMVHESWRAVVHGSWRLLLHEEKNEAVMPQIYYLDRSYDMIIWTLGQALEIMQGL